MATNGPKPAAALGDESGRRNFFLSST